MQNFTLPGRQLSESIPQSIRNEALVHYCARIGGA
jgi:hypothetical protein